MENLNRYWRIMHKTKQEWLLKGFMAFNQEMWNHQLDQMRDLQAPEGADEQEASFYRVSELRDAPVMRDEDFSRRARLLHWIAGDWLHLSILFFLPDPHAVRGIDMDATNMGPRYFFQRVVHHVLLWMAVHFDARFASALPGLIAWLGTVPTAQRSRHAGVHVRYLLERFFCTFFNSVRLGSSKTLFPGVVFDQEEGRALGLLSAMELQFLNQVDSDPFPHHQFAQEVADGRVPGVVAQDHASWLPSPSGVSSLVATTSSPVAQPRPGWGPADRASPTLSSWCLHHVAGKLGQPSHREQPDLLGCTYAQCRFRHVDPFTLTKSEFLAGMEVGLRSKEGQPIQSSFLQAVEAQSSAFRQH
jgi:hypothetical protein